MIENSVVLPAPFGPTSATIWPSSAMSEARSSASRPPKRREMFSTRRMSAMTTCRPEMTTLHQPRKPARCEGHHEDEYAAVDHQIEARRVARDQLGGLAQRLHDERAEQRAEDRADAADDGREQRLDRDPRAVGNAGVEEEEILRIEAAAGSRDGSR